MIFRARDVGQDGVIFAFLHQAHGNSGNRSAQRHAGIHQAERTAADRCHRRGAVGLQNVTDDAHGIGKVIFAGQHG